jgi:hypothetical protein
MLWFFFAVFLVNCELATSEPLTPPSLDRPTQESHALLPRSGLRFRFQNLSKPADAELQAAGLFIRLGIAAFREAANARQVSPTPVPPLRSIALLTLSMVAVSGVCIVTAVVCCPSDKRHQSDSDESRPFTATLPRDPTDGLGRLGFSKV